MVYLCHHCHKNVITFIHFFLVCQILSFFSTLWLLLFFFRKVLLLCMDQEDLFIFIWSNIVWIIKLIPVIFRQLFLTYLIFILCFFFLCSFSVSIFSICFHSFQNGFACCWYFGSLLLQVQILYCIAYISKTL